MCSPFLAFEFPNRAFRGFLSVLDSHLSKATAKKSLSVQPVSCDPSKEIDIKASRVSTYILFRNALLISFIREKPLSHMAVS